jgi:hypothetical protein
MVQTEEDLKVEIDESQEDEAHIEYDIASYPSDYTLSGIVDMWRSGDIEIPDFQREYVWTIRQASLLIESFLLGLPVPPVFLYIDDENKNLVIDGQQRILSTVFYFEGYFGIESVQGKRQVFRLLGLDERSPFYRKKFSDLPLSAQRKLRGTVLRAINVRQLSPSGESTSIYHIFERLNTGGTPLKSQEIRNVVFRGGFVHTLRQLNDEPSWRQILGRKHRSKHQNDVELVLRVFSLRNGATKYEKPMKEHLNRAMRANQDGDTTAVHEFQQGFPAATSLIVSLLGEKPFHLRGPLNTSALDSVLCTVLRHLDSVPPDLADRFERLKKDPQFSVLTTVGTTDTAAVRERFALVESHLIR